MNFLIYVKNTDTYKLCDEYDNSYYLNEETLYYSKKNKFICPRHEILTRHTMSKSFEATRCINVLKALIKNNYEDTIVQQWKSEILTCPFLK